MSRTVHGGKRDAQRLAAQLEQPSGAGIAARRLALAIADRP
jgi:hypothetical protein